MRRYWLVILFITGCIPFLGCNKDTPPADPAPTAGSEPVPGTSPEPTPLTQSSDLQVSPAAQHVKAGDPGAAVESFLTALQNEKGDIAFNLITAKARQAMHEYGLSPQPVGSSNATYTVGRTEFVNAEKDGAYVSSIWSEPLESGQFDQYEIVWVLRKEVAGWRIAGMASEVLPSEPPLFLDFENPAEMQRKLAEAERTIAAANSNDPEIRQAQNVEPTASPDGIQR